MSDVTHLILQHVIWNLMVVVSVSDSEFDTVIEVETIRSLHCK